MNKISWLVLVIWLVGCNTSDPVDTPDPVITEILPENFRVEIPDALSNISIVSGGRVRQDSSTLRGEDIYQSLRGFIWVGESSANIIEELFEGILKAEIDTVVTFSLLSEDDDRHKDFVLNQRVRREGKRYQYELNMSDEDGTKAAQILWNLDPIEIVSILSPYNINRNEGEELADVFYRIDYTEDDKDYDATMLVSITNIPESEGLDNLMMFAGKKDEIVEVRGNSNHPNIKLIDQSFTGGRNYAFVARGNDGLNIGVASLGLPPSAVDTNEDLLTDYSVFGVFEQELNAVGITDQQIIDSVLVNAHSPAYFVGSSGFISSGSAIPEIAGFDADFVELHGLNPFVPRDIRDLEITFFDN